MKIWVSPPREPLTVEVDVNEYLKDIKDEDIVDIQMLIYQGNAYVMVVTK